VKNYNNTKILTNFWLLFVLVFLAMVVGYKQIALAACPELPTDKGVAAATIEVPANGTYRVWSRIMAPDQNNSSYYLDVGDNCGITVGDAQISANTWTWVDYQNGNTSSKINLNLTEGTHTIKMAGKDADVKLDRIILVSNAGCTPTGTGNNCTPDTISPTISLTSPVNDSKVYGVTTVMAEVSDDVGVVKVEFLIDGEVAYTSQTPPYNFTWDTTEEDETTKVLTAKAYDAAGNVGTSSTVTVTVDQSAAPLRVMDGLTVLYNFAEGSGNTVNDTSGTGSPLNLTIQDTNKIRWLQDTNGIDITAVGSSVRSTAAATKVHSSLSSTGRGSFEA
jgi:hypothetical protein